MKYSSKFRKSLLPACITAVSMGAVAEEPVLEEVIVTAEKTSANLQEVPIPVTALSPKDLKDSNFGDLFDLTNMVPGVSIGGTGARENPVSIRGLASALAGIGQDEPVALYVDGVYMGRNSSFRNAVLGVERIEVLRGPQGTLYGRNAVGGAIAVTTRKPNEEKHAEISVSVGNYESRVISGLYSGQISDGVYGLISGKLDERNEGWQKNLADNQWSGNTKNESAFRGVLRFTPSEDLEFSIIADYSDYEGNEPFRNVLDFAQPRTLEESDPNDQNWDEFWAWPNGSPALNAGIADDRRQDVEAFISDAGFSTNLLDSPFGTNKENKGIALVVDYDLGDITLTSITGVRSEDVQSQIDSYARPYPTTANNINQSSDQFSEEIRLASNSDGPLQWLVGLAYFQEKVERLDIFRRVFCENGSGPFLAFGDEVNPTTGELCFPNAETELYPYSNVRLRNPTIDISSWALFGQASYDVTDKLTTTVGLRFSYEEKDWTLNFDNFGSLSAHQADDSWDQVSPKFAVTYQVNDDTMLFVSATKGFKSGGFDARSSRGPDPFDPETSIQYEVGAKTEWLENRLRLNIAGFFTDYEDLQVRITCDDPSCISSTAIENAAEAEIKGVELEFAFAATDKLTLRGFVNYLDATFTDYVASDGDFTGNLLPRAPEWQYSLTGDYTFPLKDTGEISINSAIKWTDEEYFSQRNRPIDINDSNVNLNARLTYRNLSGRWEVALFGTNLTDERYRNSVFTIGTINAGTTYNPPRMYGVEFNWGF